ncbi:MAG TPA: hypothetical protein VGL53_06640 [Bryobacteraceae bacterium]|jgi:hypothetical protein
MIIRQLLLGLSLAGAVPLAFAQSSTTTTATRSYQFQPIGLGSTETASINVYNSASDAKSGTASSCTGSISFMNGSGTAIGGATSFTLTSGQVFSATLPFSGSGGSGVRTIVIGSVSATFTSGTPCNLSMSLETYDTASGATHVELAGPAAGNGGVGPNGR